MKTVAEARVTGGSGTAIQEAVAAKVSGVGEPCPLHAVIVH